MNRAKDVYNVCDLMPPRDTSGDIKIVMLPMRDGVKLQTIIYFPRDFKGKAGVMLVRTPYTRTTEMCLAPFDVNKLKVIAIMQACRGTGWSEGVFDPADPDTERQDAEDLFSWLNGQPWYNGRCVMAGASYPGWVQWCAMAAANNTLTATAPHVAPVYGCRGSARPGGSVRFSFTLCWLLTMYHRRKYGYGNVPDYQQMGLLKKLPVIDADLHARYPELPFFRRFFSAALEPAKLLFSHRETFSRYTCPAYISGGWFDPFKSETLESFQLMKSSAATLEARNFTRLVIGPWGHGGLLNPDVFGSSCDYRHLDKWRSHFLTGLLKAPHRDPLAGEPVVRYYMLCENRWYEDASWPPERAGERCFYLHSGGKANSLYGDGRISEEKPGSEPADVYISDPNDPVLSDAGTHECIGCHDRSGSQKRSDVLVYTTEKFSSPLTVTGKISLRFTASVSTPDTDFAATLSYVTPEGKAMLLTTGMLRARFRNIEKEELLLPGELYEFEIDLSHIAFKILPGYALRLELCGQHFPAYERNANSGGPLLQDTELFLSRHTIYHDAEHPAVLTLPCW